jgi:hypothetical protein
MDRSILKDADVSIHHGVPVSDQRASQSTDELHDNGNIPSSDHCCNYGVNDLQQSALDPIHDVRHQIAPAYHGEVGDGEPCAGEVNKASLRHLLG